MNVIYVYRSKINDHSPGINFVIHSLNALAKKRSDIEVYLLIEEDEGENINKAIRDYFDIKKPENLIVLRIENDKLPDISTSFYISAYRQIKKLLKKNDGENFAIITRTDGFLPFLSFLRKKDQAKTFFEAHDYYLNRSERNKGLKKYFYHKIFLARIDGILVHQNILRNLYSEKFPEQNIMMARTGLKKINYDIDTWTNDEILYIGSLDDRKNIYELIKAFKNADNKNLILKIVGGKTRELYKKIENYSREMNLEDRVEITGWVSQEKITKHLKKAKIGVVPLADNYFNNYLTSPVKVFDYFSYGIPIVSTETPATLDVISKDCGLFYNSEEELTDCINKLDKNKTLYKNIRENIFARAENFLWDKRAEKVMQFLEKIFS